MSEIPPPPGNTPPPPPPGNTPGWPVGEAPTPGPQVGTAASWAVAQIGRNAPVLLAFAAVIVVINFIGRWVSGEIAPNPESVPSCSGLEGEAAAECLKTVLGGTGSILGLSLVALVVVGLFWVLSLLAEIGLINAGLKLTRGERVELADFWQPRHFWQYLLVGLVFGVCFVFGLFLCIIPGLFVLWAWQFARYAALDTGRGVFASLGESFRLAMTHKGPAVITLAVVFAAQLFGVLTCGVGFLVSAPFCALFMANMYRQFRGELVAA